MEFWQPIHLCHADDGVTYLGYGHKECNEKAARDKRWASSKVVDNVHDIPSMTHASRNGSVRIDDRRVQQLRCTPEERGRLLREWKAAIKRWHEAMNEAIRHDDGSGNYDAPIKAAEDEWDAAEKAWTEAGGVRVINGRRENWNGKDWIDAGREPWW